MKLTTWNLSTHGVLFCAFTEKEGVLVAYDRKGLFFSCLSAYSVYKDSYGIWKYGHAYSTEQDTVDAMRALLETDPRFPRNADYVPAGEVDIQY